MAGGRPKKEIDRESFEKLCGLQCTEEEICSFLNVTDKTLTNWCRKTYKKSFSEVFKIKRGTGKIALRRSQFRLAETNATMAIWLGKQYLGQSDNPVRDTGHDSGTTPLVDMLMKPAPDRNIEEFEDG